MKAKIKSTIPIYQTRDFGMAYVTREIYKWNIDLDKNIATPLIREEAYVMEDKVITVEDENSETGFREEVMQVRKVVEKLKDYASTPFEESTINNLFKVLQNPIEVSEDFMSELRILLQSALLMNTRGFEEPFYGLTPEQLEIDTE